MARIKRCLISTNRLREELPIFDIRELKENEKGKSIDYWEGYTKAARIVAKYLSDYEQSKEKNLKTTPIHNIQ